MRSTALQLVFHGKIGVDSTIMPGGEQYRAPELLLGMETLNRSHKHQLQLIFLGWRTTSAIDCFAIGCVIAEMVNKKPLFCPCPENSTYFHNRLKILVYVLGSITEQLGRNIEDDFPGTFRAPDYRILLPQNAITSTTQQFIDYDALPLNVSDISSLSTPH